MPKRKRRRYAPIVKDGGKARDKGGFVHMPCITPAGGGSTFFLADAEAGGTSPWSYIENNIADNPAPVSSTTRFKTGARSYRFERSSAAALAAPDCKVQFLQFNTTTPGMGPTNRFYGGWYSFWTYIDSGFTETGWNMLLGWMSAGIDGVHVDPICHVGLEIQGGLLQYIFYLKNASPEAPNYTPPEIPNYTRVGGEYKMTAQSPAGIVAFPRNQWVHTSIHYVMAATNGRIEVWQGGVKIMDLTAPTLNTIDGNVWFNNETDNMIIQFGLYAGARTIMQRMYVDDFKVTDARVVP